jgi:serine/threonine protein kinase
MSEIYIHNYKVLSKLGKGAFSTVFKGIHRVNENIVALKVSSEKQTREAKILAYLNREITNSENILPIMHWYGLYDNNNNTCIATSFYETTFQCFIDNIYKTEFEPNIKLLGICEQLINVIAQIHSAYIVHSDIKPDNFMIDKGDNVIIIDFGLSSLFYNIDKDVYKDNKPCEHLIGSPKYASYNLHVGNSISCRDDLLSIGYMMMMIFKIEMPWSNMEESMSLLPLYHIRHPANVQRAKYKQIDVLIKYLFNDLRNHPAKHYIVNYLIPYFETIYTLKYEELPDYKKYAQMFSTLY